MHIIGTRSCPSGKLKCNNGRCIDKNQYCYGLSYCDDNTQFPNADCRKFSNKMLQLPWLVDILVDLRYTKSLGICLTKKTQILI